MLAAVEAFSLIGEPRWLQERESPRLAGDGCVVDVFVQLTALGPFKSLRPSCVHRRLFNLIVEMEKSQHVLFQGLRNCHLTTECKKCTGRCVGARARATIAAISPYAVNALSWPARVRSFSNTCARCIFS
jgi:hypothetical protein